jgi:hypothetical protein
VVLAGVGLSLMTPTARAPAPAAAAPAEEGTHSLEVRHKDLLVVGPGVLGTLIAQQWFKVRHERGPPHSPARVR